MAEIKSLITLDDDFHIEFENIFAPREKLSQPSNDQMGAILKTKEIIMNDFFIMFTKNKALIDTLTKVASVLSHDRISTSTTSNIQSHDLNRLLNELNDFFKSTKIHSPIVLDGIILQILTGLLKNIVSIAAHKTTEDLSEICFLLLKAQIFLQNHCLYFIKNTLMRVDDISQIAAICYGLFENLVKKDGENAEKIATKYKKLIDRVTNKDKSVFIKSYYAGMIKLSMHKNMEMTTYYALKLLKEKDTTKDGDIVFGGSFLLACQLLTGHYKDTCQNFEQAFFWITRLHDTALELMESRQEKEIVENALLYYQKNYLLLKEKVFSQKVEYIKTRLQATDAFVESFYDPKGVAEEFVKLKVSSGLFPLVKLLRKQNIICVPNKKDSFICIYNVNFIPNISLSKSIKEWKVNTARVAEQQNVHKFLLDKPPVALTPVVFVAPQHNSAEEDHHDKEAPKPLNTPKNDKVKTRGIPTKILATENIPTVPTVKQIDWGKGYPVYIKGDSKNSVYKIRGETVKNHYVCINPQLFAAMSAEPIKLKSLVSLCNRGKALNDSTGGRGFIIKGENAEAKDAGHDHRFFGHVVRSTVVMSKTAKPKTVKLIEINEYKKTHNQDKTVKYGTKQASETSTIAPK